MNQPTIRFDMRDMKHSHRGSLTGAAIVAVVTCIGFGSPAWSQNLDEIEREITRLETDMKRLEERYVNPQLLEQTYQIETRINDGRVFYLLKDFTRASIIFMDLAHNEKIRGTPAHRDALFYLGDSLYLNKNYVGARKHFNDLLTIGAKTYFQDTVRRLIEIAITTEDYANVENLYNSAKARGASPDLMYIYGKSLFFRNKNSEAVAIFRGVPGDSEPGLQAMYFQGVILAKEASARQAEGRFDSAQSQFEKVLSSIGEEVSDPELMRLQELSRMALGRLYYEMGKYELAVEQYALIPRVSPYFARSLFEVTWTYVKSGQHKSAQRNLDILLLLEPDSALAPEARLMRGDLQLRLAEYGEAVGTYQEIIDGYEPVKAQLSNVIKRGDGAKAYFDALVGRDVGALNQINLPKVVEAWINDDPKMAKTLGVAHDLEVTRVDIEESNEIIAELEDAINSRSKVDIFPELKEGWGRGLELESSLISFKRQLLDREGKLARKASSDKSQYEAARSQREKLQKVYDTVPKNRTELSQREKKVKKRYQGLEIQLFKIGYDIDSMRAQLVAMSKWIQDVKAESKDITENEERAVREGMAQQQSLIDELEKERMRLRRIVRRAEAQTGINDEIAEQETEIKNRYQAALAREQQALRNLRGSLGSGRSQADQMGRLFERIVSIESGIGSYFDKLEKIVAQKVKTIRNEVDQEKLRVGQYYTELQNYTGDSSNLAGDIALSNFRRVEEKFDALILKADVGIIDVAWKRKEDRTNRIKDLFKHKNNDLKNLEKVFEDVRRGN